MEKSDRVYIKQPFAIALLQQHRDQVLGAMRINQYSGNSSRDSDCVCPMPYDPASHHRRSTRLKGYNYSSAGMYFITLCCYQRQCLFGDIVNGEMHLNSLGQIVANEWLKTPHIRPDFDLDEWVIMPNHIHGIIKINPVAAHDVGTRNEGVQHHPVGAHNVGPHHPVGAHSSAPLRRPHASRPHAEPDEFISDASGRWGVAYRRPRSLSSFVAGFKSATTRQINIRRNALGTPVWQRNYYDRIIRNEESLQQIQIYIQNNPVTWQADQLNPNNRLAMP